MKPCFDRMFLNHPESPASGAGGTDRSGAEDLAQRSQVHGLQLELAQRDQTIKGLQDEIERLTARQERLLQDALRARLNPLYATLAGPVVQLTTQEYLLAQGTPVQAADVLAVARRLVRELLRSGLALEEQVGSCVPFDPQRHVPLDPGSSLQPGQRVRVRFAGASLEGQVLQKAIVEGDRTCQDV